MSQQLLGQKIPSRQGSDDDDDEGEDSDDSQRLTIDDRSQILTEKEKARTVSQRNCKRNSNAESSDTQRKANPSACDKVISRRTVKSVKENIDSNRGKKKPVTAPTDAPCTDRQDGQVEVSRQNPSRSCKRKRSATVGESPSDHSRDPAITPDSERPAKRGRGGVQNPTTRSSPSKASSVKPDLRGQSLISLAAVAAGLDTFEYHVEEKGGAQGDHFSMPTMEDLSSTPAASSSGVESESHTGSHTLSSKTGIGGKSEPQIEDPHTGAQTRYRKSKAVSATSEDKIVGSSRPVRKVRALPSRFSRRSLGENEAALRSSKSPVSSNASPTSSSPKAGRLYADESKAKRADVSPAAASFVSSPSVWMVPSVEGGESLADEGDAASAGVTPHYGTDTDFSEYNPDSPCSSTSVYSINPQYVMQLRQRLQQQQQQQSPHPSDHVSDCDNRAEQSVPPESASDAEHDPVSSKSSQNTIAMTSSTTDNNHPVTSAALHAHHRDDTNDSWFALLTQAELCREEQQKQQLIGSPGQFAEVIVGSSSQLSSIVGGIQALNRDSIQPLPQQQQQDTEPSSNTLSQCLNQSQTLNSMSPQKGTVTPLSPPKAMFPSPEKSFFTIGWALGAGVSPIKQEWKLQASSEDLPRSSVGINHAQAINSAMDQEEPSGSEDDAGHDLAETITDCSSKSKVPININKSKCSSEMDYQGAGTSSVACVPDITPDHWTDSHETLQTVSTEGNTSADAEGAIILPAFTPSEEGGVLVLSDTSMGMCGGEVDACPPQELYQIVEGPDGEYQMVGLTSADLYNFVDSEGRSLMFSQTSQGVDNAMGNYNRPSIITVEESIDQDTSGIKSAGNDSNKDRSSIANGSSLTRLKSLECADPQLHAVQRSEQMLGQDGAGWEGDVPTEDLSEEETIPQFVPAGYVEIKIGREGRAQQSGGADGTSIHAGGSLSSDICGSSSAGDFEAKNLGTSKAQSEVALLVSSVEGQGQYGRNRNSSGGDENANNNNNNAEDVDNPVSCERNDKCDGEEKDDGGLYNLQMLGEVALSSEVPARVAIEKTTDNISNKQR